MTAKQAFAGDLRRVGVVLIVVGFVAVYFLEKAPVAAPIIGIVIEFVGNAAEYWMLYKEQVL